MVEMEGRMVGFRGDRKMEERTEEIMERGIEEAWREAIAFFAMPHSLALLCILVLLPTANTSFCNLTKLKAILLFHRHLPR